MAPLPALAADSKKLRLCWTATSLPLVDPGQGSSAAGSATGKDLLHTRLGYSECSRFIADPLLWKCG
jgi:hypothetical protein